MIKDSSGNKGFTMKTNIHQKHFYNKFHQPIAENRRKYLKYKENITENGYRKPIKWKVPVNQKGKTLRFWILLQVAPVT